MFLKDDQLTLWQNWRCCSKKSFSKLWKKKKKSKEEGLEDDQSMIRLNLIIILFSLDKPLGKGERDVTAASGSSNAFKVSGEPKGGTSHSEAPSCSPVSKPQPWERAYKVSVIFLDYLRNIATQSRFSGV